MLLDAEQRHTRLFSLSLQIFEVKSSDPLWTSAMTISLPPGVRTFKTSRRSVGKAGHQKCVSTAVMKSKSPSAKGNRETDTSRTSTRPLSIHCWFVCIAIAMLSNLLKVLPQPQPTSRMMSCFPIEACNTPPSVTLEWREFIFRRTHRPKHPAGFWHRLTRELLPVIKQALLPPTVALLRRENSHERFHSVDLPS